MSKILVNSALIIAMTVINRLNGWWIYVVLGVIFTLVLALNFKDILRIMLLILPKKLLDKLPFISKIANKLLELKINFKKG